MKKRQALLFFNPQSLGKGGIFDLNCAVRSCDESRHNFLHKKRNNVEEEVS
jgi:hypothetical protein